MKTDRYETCIAPLAVSVIVPVYRPGTGFRRCLASLRGQTLENIEMIFVDDLGGDDTMAYIEAAAQEDQRIRIIRNDENSGPGVSCNRGIEAARGEYLAFVDADDYLEPDFLNRLYSKARETGEKIVCGEVVRVYEDGKECINQGNPRSLRRIEEELKEGRALYVLFTNDHFSAIYQRRWIMENDVRYGEPRNGEDRTFLLRACHSAAQIACVEGVHYYYVQRKGSLVHTISPERLRCQEMSLKDQIDYILERIQEPDIGYVFNRLCYPMQLAQTARMNGYAEDASASELEICRQMDRLPCRGLLMQKNPVLRAMREFGVNLAEAALQPDDDEGRAKMLLDEVSRIAAFACGHPKRQDIYGSLYTKIIRRAIDFDHELRHKKSPALKTYRKQLMRTLTHICTNQRKPFNTKPIRLIGMYWYERIRPYGKWIKGVRKQLHPIRKAGAALGNLKGNLVRMLCSRKKEPVPAHEEDHKPGVRVSVVLPVYNPGEGIVACLQSLRSQTLRDIEMIFVDDRGTDQAMDLIREAAAQDARIRILVNEVNSGSGISRNRGLEAAQGEYVAFVDPDDYIAPDFLERLYGQAQRTQPDIVKGECRMVDGQGRIFGNTSEFRDNDRIRRGLRLKRPIFALFTRHHWLAIYRRAFLMDNGVRYGLTRNAQDTTFLLRVGLAAQSIEFDDQAIYYYVTRGDSRMRDYSRDRLNNDLAAVREQLDSLPAYCEEQKEFRIYASGRIMYALRIQATIAQKDPELGRWFLAEIRRLVRENPYLKQIQNRTVWLRALVQYGANLSVVPYKPQGQIEDVHAYVGLIRNWTEFLEQHASWTEQCRRSFKDLVRQTFLSREMRACSRAERRQVKKEIHALVNRFPNTYALVKGSLSMTLFICYGIDCFRQIDWLKRMLSAS